MAIGFVVSAGDLQDPPTVSRGETDDIGTKLLRPLRFAIFGTGFWSRFQLAAWRQIGGVECVAAWNRTHARAQTLAKEFGIPRVYQHPEELLRNERLDFIDIITDPVAHKPLTLLGLQHRVPVICQKPMADNWTSAREMVAASQSANVPLYIHENWRWQRPLREVKQCLLARRLGRTFRARIEFCCSFPVFDNQPFLRQLEQFILSDLGSHLLDTARFLFGEAHSLTCTVDRIHSDIRGEDVATVVLNMADGMTVICQMSYASRTERERFPQTFVEIEGSEACLSLGPDYRLAITNAHSTETIHVPPVTYDWADPAYALVHASIVSCQENLLSALRGEAAAETTAADNLRTMQLVHTAYESALRGTTIVLDPLPVPASLGAAAIGQHRIGEKT